MSDAVSDMYDRSSGKPCYPERHKFQINGNCHLCGWSRFELRRFASETTRLLGEPDRCSCGAVVRWEGANMCYKCYDKVCREVSAKR
jgi:hypothetical protein